MSSTVNDRYLEARVMSATPVELVRMLYGAAQQSVREARRHLAAGNVAEPSREISRAFEILVELSMALDHKRGGKIARDLAELYDYIRRRLLDANIRQEDEPLAEAGRLLATLEEAWDQVEDSARPAAPAPAAPAPEPEPPHAAAGYGAFMGAPAYAAAGRSWSA